ncbi:HAD family hydrolase [Teredinibacter turnerae]|uniref:histidinol-phosphatase n=1 Tax=Teredinibacter turnerae TaxID=2426 RepID=UPI0003788CCC|nr:HAD family hydrolase [Teredinibacter turnerae]
MADCPRTAIHPLRLLDTHLLSLAIFDLDNTLIGGDSDHAWGEFLVAEKIVDADTHSRTNDQFYEDYKRGTLDIHAYLRFALAPLKQYNMTELDELHQRFFAACIRPLWLPKAEALIASHRQQGHRLLVITATNRFITAPIVAALGIDDLLASDAEIVDNHYTGEPSGIPCFQQGKVERLKNWLAETGETLANSYFYSDSANDLPLLQVVDHPVAVDPDERLRAFAEQHQWPILSLR